jgi:WS/DGAT/MGAT family acyltransferase
VAYGRARLADVELVKSTFGTTVNDVVLAAASLSLRNYLEAHGDLPDRPLVAMVPVSVRTPEEAGTFDNRVSAFFVRLPVQLADPVDQLLATQAESRAAKQLHAGIGGSLLGSLAELASPALFSKAMRLYSGLKLANRHRPLQNLVISNVPGPPFPLYAAGARVEAAYPHGPVLEGAGMNITVMRYQDSLDFGVIACRENVPDVSAIALGFGAAVADLVKRAFEEIRCAEAEGTAA